MCWCDGLSFVENNGIKMDDDAQSPQIPQRLSADFRRGIELVLSHPLFYAKFPS